MAAQLVKSVARRADSRARRRTDRAGVNGSQARDAWPAKPQYRIRTNSRISDAHEPRYQEGPPSSRACASRQTLIFTQIASRKLDCTQCFFYFPATHRHGGQRGIYPTLMVRHTIKPGLFEKPHIKHHQCGRSGSRRRAKASVPLARRPRSLPRRPEHARATAPQRAQRVNFVVRWGLLV
ncbi:hypothetical protein Turpa_3503 [Turneriella parva DSM 21527]|uniref:Uncharacterized protein n=1 Tax=Turneriella parva (strain ATCC BAA-1111 / DSM 21527 / NCTC 11395 / H) TaxID=869212 RepID=I4BA33_TURPD|nr:hypothetical protein Turpa_3503 [Turneriella parva DSM 21527]